MRRETIRKLPKVAAIKNRITYHLNYHRIEWAVGLAVVSFIAGWLMHSDGLKHFAEFTLAPAAEAFLSKQLD